MLRVNKVSETEDSDTRPKFNKELAKTIQDVGQYLINWADDIAGDTPLINKLDIQITFIKEGEMFLPVIEVTKGHVCKNTVDRLQGKCEEETQ